MWQPWQANPLPTLVIVPCSSSCSCSCGVHVYKLTLQIEFVAGKQVSGQWVDHASPVPRHHPSPATRFQGKKLISATFKKLLLLACVYVCVRVHVCELEAAQWGWVGVLRTTTVKFLNKWPKRNVPFPPPSFCISLLLLLSLLSHKKRFRKNNNNKWRSNKLNLHT